MYLKKLVTTTCLLFFGIFISNAQPVSKSKIQSSYLSSYESKTLSPDSSLLLLPYNRWIDPVGDQIYFGKPEQENHALDVSLSPDQKWLAVEGRYEIVLISPTTKKIVATLRNDDCVKNQSLMSTFSGICWSQKGDQYHIYWSAVGKKSSSCVLQANWESGKLSPGKSFPFEAVKPAETALPNELFIREEVGKDYLYVVLNGNNSVTKLDIASGQKVWSTSVGVAPFGITYANGKLYVTNWAGNQPETKDIDVAGVPWGSAKVNAINGATREGTVSVLDPADGKILKEITVGLHPNDVIASHDQTRIFVANANSDEVTVINTENDSIAEVISVSVNKEKNSYWGASPNGLAISEDDAVLYVANGMDNALAVIELGKESNLRSKEMTSEIEGFIPTGAYPGAVAVSKANQLFVANIEAEGAKIPSYSENSTKPKYNSHRMMASVTAVAVPTEKALKEFTKKVESSSQHFRLALTEKLPRKNCKPVPVPERIGEPSTFKHVLYIIKENRTYDQVLGDIKKGNGDSTLTVFGRKVTPNTHLLARQFLLMDNYYASGKCSAEGHQWTDASIVTDYVEKAVRAWFRSYPHVQEDALVYAPSGFLWDNALNHGKKVRIYGEACAVDFGGPTTWTSVYNGFLKNEKLVFKNTTTIKPVEKILSQNFPSSDNHLVPDVVRAQNFISELKEFEQMPGDQFPELMIMALSNDHTTGTRPGLPTPRAMVADNDLALGQIVEALSKSKFWKNTVIFVTEDDSQDGWDHVSAYRTVGTVISPYSRTGSVIHTNYNQVSMVRTIEQILGIPPMNVMDATAMPMFDCFSPEPDITPYAAVKNEIPLNEMNPQLTALKGQALHYAKRSMEPQFDGIDTGDDDLFNRILWSSTKGNEKYPKRYSGKDKD